MKSLYLFLLLLSGFCIPKQLVAVDVNLERREGPELQERNLQNTPDTTIINSILNQVGIEFETVNVENINQNVDTGFLGLTADVRVIVGGEDKLNGTCNNFGLNGRLSMAGSITPSGGRERFSIPISLTGLQVTCVIPLKVEIRSVGVIPSGFINSDSAGGEITFETQDLSVSQEISIFSPNFGTDTATSFTVGDCSLDLGNYDIDADDVLNIIGGTISLNRQIEDALDDGSSTLVGPMQDILCDVLAGLSQSLGEVMVNNPLTAEDDLLINNPFSEDSNGVVDALEVEKSIVNTFANDSDIMNLRKSNFFTDILFPEDGDEEERFIETMLSEFQINGETVTADDITGVIVAILNLQFDTELSNPLTDFDVLEFLKSELGVTLFPDTDDLLNPDMLLANETFDLGEFGDYSLQVRMTRLSLSQGDLPSTPKSFLKGLDIIGNYTLLAPELALGSFVYDVVFEIDLGLRNEVAGDILPAFDVTIPTETLRVEGTLSELVGGIAALMAIKEDELFALQVGSLLSDTLDCLASSLEVPIQLTGFSVSATGFEGEVSGAQDVLVDIVQEFLNAFVMGYQSLFPRVVETLVSTSLLDPTVELAQPQPGACPVILENVNNTDVPYDFSEGITTVIVDAVDAEFMANLISFFVSSILDDPTVPLVIIDEERDFTFEFNLIPIDGWSQTIQFALNEVSVVGLNDITVNFASFDVPEDSENYPQGLQLALDAAIPENDISLQVKITMNILDPVPDEDVIAEGRFVADEPPQSMVNAVANNIIDIEIFVENVNILIEIFAALSIWDVDGTTIDEGLNIPCWVGKLDPYGGWTDIFDVIVGNVRATMDCDCNTTVLNQMAVTMEDPEGWDDLRVFGQEILNGFIKSLQDKYREDEFDFTIRSAQSQCATGQALTQPITNIPEELNSYGQLGAFTALLVFAMWFWIPIVLCRRRKVDKGESMRKKSISEKSLRQKPDLQAAVYASRALYRNTGIPLPVRLFVGIALFTNLLCFVYGDLGVALIIGLDGDIVGSPLASDDFLVFSVISSTIDLFESGAIYLAVLLFVLAIFWPYLKVLSMLFCFYGSPGILSMKKRSKILHFLDRFGKWSTVEIFFLVFLRIVFELRVGTPDVGFLPEKDLYSIELLLSPQLSLYIFVFAVMLSIILSNILVWYQDKLTRLRETKVLLERSAQTSSDQFIKMKLIGFEFSVAKADKMDSYSWKLTQKAKSFFHFMALFCYVFVFLSCALPVIRIEYLGLAGLALDLDGQGTVFEFSVFNVMAKSNAAAVEDEDAGSKYILSIFIFCILIVPFFVTVAVQMMYTRAFTLKDAIEMRTKITILVAWSAFEVFMVSIAFAVFELPHLAGYVSEENCALLTEFMRDTLLNFGFVSEADVRSTCFGIDASITPEAFIVVTALVIRFMYVYLVLQLFNLFIDQRKNQSFILSLAKAESEQLKDEELRPVKYSMSVKFLKRHGFIKAFRKNYD
eukprot:snap_masked-scaffold_1-processed-gene-28.7-mRNA-1 protein AED:1.00 eAED:1.00 QI:0/0/0/0/1/1/2/0/1472